MANVEKKTLPYLLQSIIIYRLSITHSHTDSDIQQTTPQYVYTLERILPIDLIVLPGCRKVL